MPSISVVNLIGEPITVGSATFPSAGLASVGAVQEIKGVLDTEVGHFLVVKEAEVSGLPAYNGRTRYIVTREVADAAKAHGRPGYDLLYSPSEPFRDEDGQLRCDVLTCGEWT